MNSPKKQINCINSQDSIQARLAWVIQECWLTVEEIIPKGEFETENFDLRTPKIWIRWRFFSRKTQLTIWDVAEKIQKVFPAQLERPQIYKVDKETIRVIFQAGYPKDALGAHRDLAKMIFNSSDEERNAIVEQMPNYQDINVVMALMMSFIEQKAVQVLSGKWWESLKVAVASSKLLKNPLFEIFPEQAAGVFAQASRNIVRFCYSWYFLEQHLLKQGYQFDEKELFKRLYYILIPEAFFPVMSSALHYEQVAVNNKELCNPNLLHADIWDQIETDYKHAKSLDKPRICPALSMDVFAHCKEFLFDVFSEAQSRQSLWWDLHKDHWLDTILDFEQYLDLSPEVLDNHPAVIKK